MAANGFFSSLLKSLFDALLESDAIENETVAEAARDANYVAVSSVTGACREAVKQASKVMIAEAHRASDERRRFVRNAIANEMTIVAGEMKRTGQESDIDYISPIIAQNSADSRFVPRYIKFAST